MKQNTLSLAILALIGNVSASEARGWRVVDIQNDQQRPRVDNDLDLVPRESSSVATE